ncbi:hypothetical protein [Methylobacterium sp. J-030]|uniref:hypothetical protein n=1 Tax=Methylobacterium sp. J-030 TaxID=2836627 RepID=UPI001FBAD533|nr:hypothetical protein [Methylobacterium sp. J-030]
MAGLCLAFAYIAGAVTEGDTGSFDRRVRLLFRVPGNPAQTIGPPWLTETMRT